MRVLIGQHTADVESYQCNIIDTSKTYLIEAVDTWPSIMRRIRSQASGLNSKLKVRNDVSTFVRSDMIDSWNTITTVLTVRVDIHSIEEDLQISVSILKIDDVWFITIVLCCIHDTKRLLSSSGKHYCGLTSIPMTRFDQIIPSPRSIPHQISSYPLINIQCNFREFAKSSASYWDQIRLILSLHQE